MAISRESRTGLGVQQGCGEEGGVSDVAMT